MVCAIVLHSEQEMHVFVGILRERKKPNESRQDVMTAHELFPELGSA